MSLLSLNSFSLIGRRLPAAAADKVRLQSRPKTTDASFDLVIVGGGIIGCATGRELSRRHPHLKLAIVEKESRLAAHQSGHNSGVIHAGIYYTPGSLKAKLCVEGMNLAYEYCQEKGIEYKKCGKLIVAVEPHEVPILEGLFKRGQQNGVKDLELIEGKDIKQLEPYCEGLKALWSPRTGIVNWAQVNQSYGNDFRASGGSIWLNFRLDRLQLNPERSLGSQQYPVQLIDTLKGRTLSARFVVTAAGLQSDRVAQLTDCSPIPKIVPFRGEYLVLKPEKSHLVRSNIYPVPDPRYPFLGVHFTPRMDGSVWLGPNAVLAFQREGYKLSDFNFQDTLEAFKFSGLRKFVFKNAAQGARELYRSLNTKAQVDLLRRFVPSLTAGDVTPGPSGVRAQALDDKGRLVDDFVFDGGPKEWGRRVLHVRNAPSPAATSSLAIANMIVDKVEQSFFN